MENKEKIYETAYVYAIKSPNTDKVYIGSTHKKLNQRFSEHKYEFIKGGKYYTSHDVLKEGDAYIELLKTFTDISESSLRREEGEVIKQTENAANKQIAGRTIQEWFDDHKEEIKEYKKQYQIENREKIAEGQRKYAENNKEKIADYQHQYRELNKEALSESKKIYRQNNIEKIKANRTKIYICECGSSVQKSNKGRHEKTQCHQQYLLRN